MSLVFARGRLSRPHTSPDRFTTGLAWFVRVGGVPGVMLLLAGECADGADGGAGAVKKEGALTR